jgi:hypothetical protein
MALTMVVLPRGKFVSAFARVAVAGAGFLQSQLIQRAIGLCPVSMTAIVPIKDFPEIPDLSADRILATESPPPQELGRGKIRLCGLIVVEPTPWRREFSRGDL